MPGSYPHTRATGFTTYSTCRCGHTLSTPQASIHPPYYPAPTTWGDDCPAAMREHIAALEAEVASLRAVADIVTGVREQSLARVNVPRADERATWVCPKPATSSWTAPIYQGKVLQFAPCDDAGTICGHCGEPAEAHHP